MNDASQEIPRSYLLTGRAESALLVVDVQTKLLNLIPNHERLTFNIGRMIDAARLFEIPVVGTEQYPQGLGPTEASLAEKIGPMPDKVKFSCAACAEALLPLKQAGRHKLVVTGIETHVCIQQTVFDLLSAGFEVLLVLDAIAARHAIDHDTAIRRMESAGATLVTTETMLFEWCEGADDPQFKAISALVRQSPPA